MRYPEYAQPKEPLTFSIFAFSFHCESNVFIYVNIFSLWPASMTRSIRCSSHSSSSLHPVKRRFCPGLGTAFMPTKEEQRYGPIRCCRRWCLALCIAQTRSFSTCVVCCYVCVDRLLNSTTSRCSKYSPPTAWQQPSRHKGYTWKVGNLFQQWLCCVVLCEGEIVICNLVNHCTCILHSIVS